MKHVIVALVVAGVLVSGRPAWAQPPTHRLRNPKLALAGVITAVVGAAMLSPVGEEYHIVGYDYCATGTYTINAGKCQTRDALRPVGIAAIVAGVGMTVIGLQRVKINPTYKGVTATTTVSW